MNNLMLKASEDGNRKFDVYKRDPNGFTRKVGSVFADNKVQADTKVRNQYRRSLQPGEAVWAVDPLDNVANQD